MHWIESSTQGDLRLASVTTALWLLFLPLPCNAGADKAPWTESLSVLEHAAGPNELSAYPEDGKSVEINPPGFYWTPQENAKSYLLEIRRSNAGSRKIMRLVPVKSTAFAMPHPIDPADYSWRVVYLDADGKPYGVSRTRRFHVGAGLPQLPMPDVARLKTQLATLRPRLFLSGDRLQHIRAAIGRGGDRYWDIMSEAAKGAVAEQTYPEPYPAPDGNPTPADWRRIFTAGKVGSAHLARTALAYKLTGDRTYLNAAKRWMLALASWDPRGITSHNLPQPDGTEGVDEASMPMLERMSLAWDWIGGEFTSDERSQILACMKERGNQVLEMLQAEDYLSHPYSNHSGRVLAFLGLAGISFSGDLPEADAWLDYVLRCYLTVYPFWGGDEGGWSQGTSYWTAYVYWLTNCAEALRQITDVDIFRRPFYHNTGYFAVYFQPPYAPRGGFGDGGDHGPSEATQILTRHLANVFRDPVLKWQADSAAPPPASTDKWREWYIDDVMSVLALGNSDAIQREAPTHLDGSRHLKDIGWVAMHSALGDAEKDVWVLFRSSRYGSFSHSHADQNSFQLNAYGRALAIDSGYYPWYGSTHDNLWTRQTWAHNDILVNGRGQPPHTWNAKGNIEAFDRHGLITVVRGQASESYNLPQPEETLSQWAESLKQPVPPMQPKVESFERTLVFVASKCQPMLVIQDFVKTDGPAPFDWLLHALNRMEIGASPGTITIADSDVRLAVRLLSTVPFQLSQSSAFNVPPESADNTAYQGASAKFPDQWHLKAHTGVPASEIKFLAVMIPYRSSEPEPRVVPFQSGSVAGFRIGASKVTAWWGAGETGKFELEGKPTTGRMVVTADEDGKLHTVVCN